MKAIDRLIDLLPIPVLVAVAFIVLGAWILKEVSHETVGLVMQQPRFHALTVAVFMLTVTYYLVVLVLRDAPVLDPGRMAILVARFEGDPDNRVQAHVLETAKTYVSKLGLQDRVGVYGLARQCSTHLDACRPARKKMNDATLWGTFYPDAILHLNVSRPDSDLESRNTISDFPESQQLERVLIDVLPALTENTMQVGSERVHLEGGQVVEALRILEQRISRLEKPRQQNPGQWPARFLDQRRLLISVGINKYERAPQLSFAVKDAQDFARLLPSLGEGSVVLTDAAATGSGIRGAMKAVAAYATADDQVWLYFAGMGINKDDESYILPHDVEPGKLASTAISLREVWQWVEGLPSRQVIVITDACGIEGPGAPRDEVPLLEGEIHEDHGGRVLIAGSRADEFVSESADLKHGIFTAFVLAGLRGGADTNGDSIVSLGEFYYYLRNAVAEYPPRRIPQHPTLYYRQTDDFYLVAVGEGSDQR
jgi:hypothetical protein